MQKRLKDVWNSLPDLDHTKKYYDEKSQLRIYEICGRKFQETCKVDYVLPILEKYEKEYGLRARQAAKNEGIDWKAVSHALRAALEVKELLRDGTITFPLENAKLIRDIKQGKYPWKEIQNILESQIEYVKQAAEQSNLPKKADRKFWNDFIIKTMKESLTFN